MVNRSKIISLYRLLSVFSFILIITTLTGCGPSCEQDYFPPIEITTNNNPYHLSYLSSDLEIGSARWENITTGASGIANVTHVNECVFPIGCGTWTSVEMDVSLAIGLNTVYTFKSSDGCEWREDYLITYN